MIMFSLFARGESGRTAYSLNREANQVAQSNPALAAELRMRAYSVYQLAGNPVAGKKQAVSKPKRSASALNSRANRIAQSKPELAIQLRMQAAYA
jgi:hypothetical protein